MSQWGKLRWRLARLWQRITTSRADRQELIWLGLDLEMPGAPFAKAPAGLHFREIPVSDVERDPLRFQLSSADFVARVQRRFFAGYIGEEWVYRMWTFELAGDDLVIVPASARPALTPPTVVVDGCYTPPAFRGRSIYPAALAWLAQQARAEGARQLVLQVRRGNVASIRAVSKAGFVPLARRDPVAATLS